MTRSAAVIGTGSATAAKLLVGALAFTTAYVGVSAYSTANSAPSATAEEQAAEEQAATRTVALSAAAVPLTEQTEPEAGAIAVSALPGRGTCDQTFMARTVVLNPEASSTLLYNWRLARWSSVSRSWKTYQTEYAGFMGARRNVKWEPSVRDNPGWYRIELTVGGAKKPIKSDRLLVSC
ncbi:hypothetical protein [Nonomuraea dietziae]|uniref:hypothetical protein n=1 Tax=Nonomuraea dietziae TaxID=65515 RepID=UPI00340DF2FA